METNCYDAAMRMSVSRLAGIDTSKPLSISCITCDDQQRVRELGKLCLVPAECAAAVQWLRTSDQLQQAVTAAVECDRNSGGKIGCWFDYFTFVRMLGMYGGQGDKVDEVVAKVSEWKNQVIPVKNGSIAVWTAALEKAGKECRFSVFGSAA